MHNKQATFALLVGLSIGNLSAGIIANGDFETGDLTGWTLFTTAVGSNGSIAPGVAAFETGAGGSSWAAQFDVGRAILEDTGYQGGGIYQVVNVGAGTLNISLDYAVAATLANGTGGSFQILIDGVQVGSAGVGFLNDNSTARGSISGSTTVSAGDHEIRILIQRDAMNDISYAAVTGAGYVPPTPRQYIDNVTASLDTSVPEPATWMATAGGAPALALLRRRRTAHS